jgi:hypothetical protein
MQPVLDICEPHGPRYLGRTNSHGSVRRRWLAPVDHATTVLALTWATRGLLTSARLRPGAGGRRYRSVGLLLEPWYQPAALTVTWGAAHRKNVICRSRVQPRTISPRDNVDTTLEAVPSRLLRSHESSARVRGLHGRHHGAAMRTALLVLGIGLSCIRPAAAEPITLVGRGTLNTVCQACLLQEYGALVNAGDPFVFSFSFDTSAVRPDPIPGVDYFSPWVLGAGTYTVSVGDLLFVQHQASWIGSTATDFVGTGTDLLGMRSWDGIVWLTGDGPAGWLSSEAWPADLAMAFNSAPQLRFSFNSPHNSFITWASGTPLGVAYEPTAEPIPEPTALLLVGTGLLGAAGARGWRQRKA